MLPRLLPLLLLASPALAQAPPRLLPSHDVSIDYRLAGAAGSAIPGGAPGALHVAWHAGSQTLRVEAPGRSTALLVDLAARSVEVVDSGLRTAMSLPIRDKDLQPMTLDGARLDRRGRETIAGLSCTDYAVQSSRGHGTICLTDDGVALRASGEVDGRQGSFTAVSVASSALPASAFHVPPGYLQLAMPKLDRPR